MLDDTLLELIERQRADLATAFQAIERLDERVNQLDRQITSFLRILPDIH